MEIEPNLSRLDWVALSVEGDVEEAGRVQGLTSREERLKLDEWSYNGCADEYLPDKRVPVPPSPGFQRLCAIMEQDIAEPDPVILADARLNWRATWAVDTTDEESCG